MTEKIEESRWELIAQTHTGQTEGMQTKNGVLVKHCETFDHDAEENTALAMTFIPGCFLKRTEITIVILGNDTPLYAIE